MVKLSKKDEKLIDDLAKTKTVRELGRVLLSYLTIEEMGQFVASYMVLKSKGLDADILDYFIHDQFFPLLKTFTLSLGDWLPDFISDADFMRLYSKLPNKLSLFKTK